MGGGFFITFEGLDGAGKSTQLRRLAAALGTSGWDVVTLRQPGGTALGDRMRSLLLDSRTDASLGGLVPEAELAMMFADRAQAIHEVIRPALKRDQIVLCDRYTDSSEAYQGAGRELGTERVLTLHRELCGDLQPDLTVLLLPPLESSLQRARRRNLRHVQQHGRDENRFERESDLFYERVYQAYERIAVREPARVVTLRSAGTLDEVETEVRRTVLSRLPQRVLPPV